jgi:hypothetical protein
MDEQTTDVSSLVVSAELVQPDYGKWPSPFDDSGVQYAWDSVSLGLLKTCPRKYFLTMVQNWQPRKRSPHLDFGIYYHSALEGYLKLMAQQPEYISNFDWHEHCVREVVHQALISSVNYEPPIDNRTWKPRNDKTRMGLIRSIVWYLDKYGINDNARPVLLSDGRPAVELSFRFSVGHDLMLAGHLDQIVSFGNEIYVMDHKTTSATVTGASARYFFKNFKPDNQMSLYSLGASVAFQVPVRGVLIDAAQIAVEFTAFQRDVTYRKEAELDEFLQGLYAYRQMAEYYHRTGFWPMNEASCGNYGGCAFRDICSQSPSVRDKFLASAFTQEKPWNPLEPR